MQAQNVQEKPTITYTADHPKYILAGLAIDGIKGFDDDYLLSLSGLNIGQIYEVPGNDISEAIRRYWAQKLFSNVRIEADSIVGNSIYLHIFLTAQPRVSSIQYHGIKKSEREDLEQMLGLGVGAQITPDMIDRAKHIIKRHFDGKGYNNAEVEIVQREDVTGDNRVLVDIYINKNEKIKVHKIYNTGLNSPKPMKKLREAMKKTAGERFVSC